MDEQAILNDLISGWVSLGLSYVGEAPDVTAFYIYVSSEQGSSYAEIFVEQAGAVLYPSDLTGTDTSVERIRRMHRLQLQDLMTAEARFDEIRVTRPTEYRVYYETATRRLDVALSRELIYANDPAKTWDRGIVDWIGDRAPRLY